jgi:hypothetical protein
MAKLSSLEKDREEKRLSDAAAAALKREEFRQKTLGDVGLEIDRGMKRLEGRTGDELDTGIHQLRGNLLNLYGATPDRPWGLTQDQLDRSLAAPGSVIPGVFERKEAAGNFVNPNYGADPTTEFYDPRSIQEIYGADTPKVGESMAVRPEGSRNFLEFANTPIDDQTKDIMGLMGQGAAKYYGGQMNMPQNFGDMMSMKPESMFRSPEEIQKAVKSGIPESVMISREREATTKDVPMRAKYGMKETDQAAIDAKKASVGLTQARTTSVLNKLDSEIALMRARTNKINTDTRLAPLKGAAQLANQAIAKARLSLAALKEGNLMKRHTDMMGYRGEQLSFDKEQEHSLNVNRVFTAMGDLEKSVMMAKQKKAELVASPNYKANDPSQAAVIKEMDGFIQQLQDQASEIRRWGVAQTGSSMEMTNIGFTGNDWATQGFLTGNPELEAMGHAMMNRPGDYAAMGSTHGYERDRSTGNMIGLSPEALARILSSVSGGRAPDSAGMGGGPGLPKPPKPGPLEPPKPPKPSPQKQGGKITRDQLLDSFFGPR